MQNCHAIYIFVKQILSLRFSKFCRCHFMLDIFCRVWYDESDSIKKNHCSKVLIPVIYGEGDCVDCIIKF